VYFEAILAMYIPCLDNSELVLSFFFRKQPSNQSPLVENIVTGMGWSVIFVDEILLTKVYSTSKKCQMTS